MGGRDESQTRRQQGEGGQEQPYIYNGNLLQSAHLRCRKEYAGDTDLCGRKGIVMPAEKMHARGKIINAGEGYL